MPSTASPRAATRRASMVRCAMPASRRPRNSRRASISSRTASRGTARCRSRAIRSRGSRAPSRRSHEWQPPVMLDEHDARVLRAAAPRSRRTPRSRAVIAIVLERRSRGRRRRPTHGCAPTSRVPCLDAADVGLAEHRSRRLPQQRDPFGGARDARRPHASRRRPRSIPRRARAPHRRRPRSTSCSTATATGLRASCRRRRPSDPSSIRRGSAARAPAARSRQAA